MAIITTAVTMFLASMAVDAMRRGGRWANDKIKSCIWGKDKASQSSSSRALASRMSAEVAKNNVANGLEVAKYNAQATYALEQAKFQGQYELSRLSAESQRSLQLEAQKFEIAKVRNQQEFELRKQKIDQDFSAWLQQNDLEFRKWLAERQSQDAFELRTLDHKYELEEIDFQHQRAMDAWRAQKYDERLFPLKTPYGDLKLRPDLNAVRTPFRVYWAETNEDTLFDVDFKKTIQERVRGFLNQYQSKDTGRLRLLFGDWKAENGERFNDEANIGALFDCLQGQPTLIINPIQNKDALKIELAYWGLGKDCERRVLFSIDLNVAYEVGKLVCEETQKYVEQGGIALSSEIEEDLKLLNKINEYRKQQGESVLPNAPYQLFKLNVETEDDVRRKFTEEIGNAISCAVARAIDLHFLSEYGDAPILPQIVSETSADALQGYQTILTILAETDCFQDRIFSIYYSVAETLQTYRSTAEEIVCDAVALWAYRKEAKAERPTVFVKPANFQECADRIVAVSTTNDLAFLDETQRLLDVFEENEASAKVSERKTKLTMEENAELKRKLRERATESVTNNRDVPKQSGEAAPDRKEANKRDENRLPGVPLGIKIAGVDVVFRYCPPGTFMMGSPEDEDERSSDENQHEVTLTRGFWLGETPVTQKLWKAVEGRNPSNFEGARRPVEKVSWNDCDRFVKKLNTQYKSCLPVGFVFTMPTEAEWEYACRACTTTAFNVGDKLTGSDANFYGNNGETTPVKKYSPNAWGLYDMHGNVWEWCKDWYCGYPMGAVTDPEGPASGSDRVVRGGGWGNYAESCRSAYRRHYSPSYCYNCDLGFRLALRSAD